MNFEDIEKMNAAARLIARSRHLVAFTGAGISTASGIPDFRSQGTGLWQRSDPMQVASVSAFRNHPDVFYNWLRPLLEKSLAAIPNPAHQALAELESRGIVHAVITQNIDALHQKAGSRNVIELHGSMDEFACPKCHLAAGDIDLVNKTVLSGSLPCCERCSAVLKPAITLFEEALPEEAWLCAEQEVALADVMLIVGTSLEVVPASSLPYGAWRNGCRLVIVNLTPTFLDPHAEVILRMDVAAALPLILEEINKIIE